MADGQFDPLQLRDDASLNRLVVDGKAAYDVLGLHALGGADASSVGAALGLLVATLLDPTTADEQGWSEWRRAYLTHWQTVADVCVGGGVAARFGEPMIRRAQQVLDEHCRHCRIRIADDPATLSLRGAGLDARLHDGPVAVLDFGHSGVKRAVATRVGGAVDTFSRSPTVEVPFEAGAASRDDVFGFVADAIVDVVESEQAIKQVSLSLATYVVDGRILPSDRSLYGHLGHDAPEALGGVVAERCKRDVRVLLSHDGTSAARAIPGGQNAAVIVMGSALASGFQTLPVRA